MKYNIGDRVRLNSGGNRPEGKVRRVNPQRGYLITWDDGWKDDRGVYWTDAELENV